MNVCSFYGKKRVSAAILNELLDTIATRNFTSADVTVLPLGDVSDRDPEKSESEEGTEHIAESDHFTSKILIAQAEATMIVQDSDQSSDEDDDAERNPEGSTVGKRRKIQKMKDIWKKR